MQATRAIEVFEPSLPFVGRGREIARLGQCHAQRKHVVIIGPAGAGKSALVRHLRERLPLLICPRSELLGEICDSLERELGLAGAERSLARRKPRLRAALVQAGMPVVFDALGWATPKLASFLESLMERIPVWLCARSVYPWDIGHCWPLLARFERVELRPFHLGETRALVEAAIGRGAVPRATLDAAERLHRLARGNPGVLCELLAQQAECPHNLATRAGLRLLDLDRRIRHLPLVGRGGPPAP